MAKRLSTDVVEELSAADIAAGVAKRNALKMIADPTFTSNIVFATTHIDRAFNIRSELNYAYGANKVLYESLRDHGLERRGDPMNFSVQTDGSLLVLNGNLRHTMMTLIRQQERERRIADGIEANESTLPFHHIFGLVYTGLTRDQETLIMADHSGRKELNEAERAAEIGRYYYACKMTDGQLAIRFERDKNKVRRLRMIYAMPTVFAEFEKEKSGVADVPFVKVGQEALNELYKAFLIDQKAGCGVRTEGRTFKSAWKKFLTVNNEQDTPPVKSKSAKDIGEQVETFGAKYGTGVEIEAIANVLRWAGGDPAILLDDAIEAIIGYIATLKSDRDGLLGDNARVSADLATMTEERDRLMADLKTITTDRDRLVKRLANGTKPVK